MNGIKKFESDVKILNTKDIKVDPLYQRSLDNARVQKMIRRFNPNIVNLPKVSFRDGKYWVFDGQHTLAMLKAMNGGHNLNVECRVFYGMSQYDERDLFIEQNGLSKNVNTIDKLRARYNSNEPDVVDMVEAAKAVGVEVDFSNHKRYGRCCAVPTLYNCYKVLSREQFVDMLKVITEAWHGIPESYMRDILVGLTKFYQTYYGEFNRKTLVKRLSVVQPMAVVRECKASSGFSHSAARVILRIYNMGTRTNKLDDRL